MSWKHKLGQSNLIQTLVGIAFFLSGIFVNSVQLVLFISLAYFNIDLYRKVNYYLTYTIWSQIVALAEWWAEAELTIYYADEKSKNLMGKEHSMFLMNHTFEIDWLVAWLTIDRYNILGNAKSFAKKSLKWIPIMGWSWIFGEFGFLDRSLEKDSTTIIKSMQNFFKFQTPISILFFPEGTRFTEEKYKNGLKFAAERNLPIFKSHLIPRVKGFLLCVQTCKQKYPSMLISQIQLKFPKNSPPPSFMSLVKCKKLKPDVYIRIFPVTEIPDDTEEATKFLFDLYKEKDELVEYYDKNNRFPGIKVKLPPRTAPLFNWLTWILISLYAILYLAYALIISGNWYSIGFVIFLFIIGVISVKIMVNSTKIQKSSDYGTKKK